MVFKNALSETKATRTLSPSYPRSSNKTDMCTIKSIVRTVQLFCNQHNPNARQVLTSLIFLSSKNLISYFYSIFRQNDFTSHASFQFFDDILSSSKNSISVTLWQWNSNILVPQYFGSTINCYSNILVPQYFVIVII